MNSVWADIFTFDPNHTLATTQFSTVAEVSYGHFVTSAKLSGRFTHKTLRHQDISVVALGHVSILGI